MRLCYECAAKYKRQSKNKNISLIPASNSSKIPCSKCGLDVYTDDYDISERFQNKNDPAFD